MSRCFFFRRAASLLAFASLPVLAAVDSGADAVSNTASTTQLDAVTVSAERPAAYSADASTTGTKTDTPLIETPQSITVITEEQLRDQGAQTVQDALRYTAGVYADAYGTDSRGDFSLIRGTEYLQYLDGTRQVAPDFIYVRPDPFQLERIDVLKGPASVLYGQSTAGGIVNLVSKQPLAKTQGEVGVQYGTFNRRQLQADFTGPIDADKQWLYRVVAVGRESGTQVDHVDDDRALLVPSLSWHPSDDTRLTVRATWQDDHSGSNSTFPPHSGTLLPNPNGRIATSTFTSEPNFDRFDTAQYGLAYEFEQKLGRVFTLRQNFRYSRQRIDYQSIYPDDFSNPDDPFIDADDRVLNRSFYVNNLRSRTFTVDNQAQVNFSTGPIQHQLLFGIDALRLSETGVTAYGAATPIDIYAPVYDGFTPPDYSPKPKLTQDQIGVYAQDQLKFGNGWVALGSLRHDRAGNKTADLDDAPGSKQDDDATTFRMGMLYHAQNGVAPYASYSQSFNPVLGVNSDGTTFKPLRGQQVETGVKWQPVGRQSFVTAAVYEIREKNRLTASTEGPNEQVQLGEGRSRGFEVEGTGHITHQLDLIGSYTLNAVVVSKSGVDAEVGRRIASIPRQQASLWAHYSFPVLDVSGFEAGAGVRYVGDSYDGNDVLRTPSVTLLDALLGYDRGAWRFAINANNLLDETYETTCLARGDCFIGQRRTVVGSVAWRW